MMSKLRNIVDSFYKMMNEQKNQSEEINNLKLQIGDIQVKQQRSAGHSFSESEFKVFSQYGDDGLLQYLIYHVDLPKTFIEFGVETYTESNTRFLLMHDNWKGLVIDGSEENVAAIKRQDIYWRYDLTAVCSFITRENINKLFTDNRFSGEIGILSIDIDGNDYWVWEAINSVHPTVVIVEYNSVFGKDHAITIPYQKDFYRSNAHYSNLYWGTSLKALCHLAEKKGYDFIGSNSAGNNAYFIRRDKMEKLKALSCEEGFVDSKFRESRDRNGTLNFLQGNERLKEIGECEVVDVISNKTIKIKDLHK